MLNLSKLILLCVVTLFVQSKLNAQCTLPANDNFDGSALNTTLWTQTSTADPNNWIFSTSVVNPPSGTHALELDGNPATSDTVSTCTFDLTQASNIVLRFSTQRGGAGNSPENIDSLICEFLNSSLVWQTLLALPGGTNETTFTTHELNLPQNAYHFDFRLRFRNYATQVTNPNSHNDSWFIDNFSIDLPPPPCVLPIFDNFEANQLNVNVWESSTSDAHNWVNSTEVVAPPSGIKALELNGNPTTSDFVTTCELDLSQQFEIKVEFQTERGGTGNAPEVQDSLICEFLNSNLTWQKILALSGGAAQTTFTPHSIILPQNALHSAFKLRFRNYGTPSTINFNDVWFVDDFHLFATVDVVGPNFSNAANISNNDNFLADFPVSANVFDGSGVDSVWLSYRIGDSGNFTTVPLNLVSGNNYAGAIPQLQVVQPTNVYYFFSARDLAPAQNTSYFPQNYQTTPYKFRTELLYPGTISSTSLLQNEIPVSWLNPGNNSIELKFDDGTSEFQSILPGSPPGLNNPAISFFATKFSLNQQAKIQTTGILDSVKIFIANNALSNAQFKVSLRKADGTNGTPGTLISETGILTQNSPFGSFQKITFGSSVSVGKEDFFVVVEQVSTTKISLGGDTSLIPPYSFKQNTFFQKTATASNWAALENLAPLYGQVIPMVRCFVKDSLVVTSSFPAGDYKLYRSEGAFTESSLVIQNGTVVYSGANNFFTDTNVNQGIIYSYAVTSLYTINGQTYESAGGNVTNALLLGGTPLPIFFVNSNSLGFANTKLTVFPNTAGNDSLLVSNVGLAPMNVTGMAISGQNAANFSIVSNTSFPLGAGISQKIHVNFNASAEGIFTAVLEIQHDAGNLVQVNLVANSSWSAVNEEKNLLQNFKLSQNYPNPFNPTTKIAYELQANQKAKLTVFNVLGEVVKEFLLEKQSGFVEWNGTNFSGKQVASGIYFYELRTENFSKTKKMILLK
ncbi:T9SS type A sorting domain-containing protein [bacterium]|nr:T9SS type A sorting domain-containing protein [bacterium]